MGQTGRVPRLPEAGPAQEAPPKTAAIVHLVATPPERARRYRHRIRLYPEHYAIVAILLASYAVAAFALL